MKAISIKQPWASLIVNGLKDIENRDWPTRFRGQVLIHAGRAGDDWACRTGSFTFTVRPEFKRWLEERGLSHIPGILGHNAFDFGGIVGIATIVDCVTKSPSPWFVGKFGFVIQDARPLPFAPLRGQLGFFDVPTDIINQLGLEVAR